MSRHNALWWWDLPAGGDAGRTPKMPVTTLVSGLLPAQHGAMRHDGSVTSISWIPSEAVTGSFRVAFDVDLRNYDAPACARR